MSHRFLLAGVLLIWGGSLLVAEDPFAPGASTTSELDPFDDPPPATTTAATTKAKKVPVRIWIDNDPEQTEAVLAQLRNERVSGELLFDGEPLEEVLQRFEANHGIAVVSDRLALEDLDLGPDEPVEARIPAGVPLAAALEYVLAPLDCTYVVRSGVLCVTTVEAASAPEHLAVAIYPVADLLQDSSYDRLMETIANVIDVDTWATNGGGEGAELVPFPQRGALLVSTTLVTHEKVAALLSGLRQLSIDPNAEPYEPRSQLGGGSTCLPEARSGGGGGAFSVATPESTDRRSAK